MLNLNMTSQRGLYTDNYIRKLSSQKSKGWTWSIHVRLNCVYSENKAGTQHENNILKYSSCTEECRRVASKSWPVDQKGLWRYTGPLLDERTKTISLNPKTLKNIYYFLVHLLPQLNLTDFQTELMGLEPLEHPTLTNGVRASLPWFAVCNLSVMTTLCKLDPGFKAKVSRDVFLWWAVLFFFFPSGLFNDKLQMVSVSPGSALSWVLEP